MRKAIKLKVILWVEGEDEPAHDFFKATSEAINDIIAAGAKSHPELKVTVRRIADAANEEEEG